MVGKWEVAYGEETLKIKLAEIADGDLPIMERWLHADHVRRAWGEPEKNIHLLRASPAAGHRRAFAKAGFQHDREFHESIDVNDVSSGHYVLMVRRRPHKENE
jgi:hypothetical protein